jgi:hypothetical protein
MTKRVIDWDAVARDYHTLDGPVAEIARKHGLAAISIYAKAKRDGWARPGSTGGAGNAKARPRRKVAAKARKPAAQTVGDVNSGRALARMMNIVNRLADELEMHLDHPDDAVMNAAEKKGAADILTSLARALEKLTVLEREARVHADAGGTAGAMQEQAMAGPEEAWDDLQRRLARLAAGDAAS